MASMSFGWMSARLMAFRAASTEIVMTSSSGEGTLLLWMFSPRPMAAPSTPHTFPMTSGVILQRGT